MRFRHNALLPAIFSVGVVAAIVLAAGWQTATSAEPAATSVKTAGWVAPQPGEPTVLTLDGAKVTELTMTAAAQPMPAVSGNAITVGKQSITMKDGHLVLAVFDESKAK